MPVILTGCLWLQRVHVLIYVAIVIRLTHSLSCHTFRQMGQSNFFMASHWMMHSLQNSCRWSQLMIGISTDLFSKQIQQVLLPFAWFNDVNETVGFILFNIKINAARMVRLLSLTDLFPFCPSLSLSLCLSLLALSWSHVQPEREENVSTCSMRVLRRNGENDEVQMSMAKYMYRQHECKKEEQIRSIINHAERLVRTLVTCTYFPKRAKGILKRGNERRSEVASQSPRWLTRVSRDRKLVEMDLLHSLWSSSFLRTRYSDPAWSIKWSLLVRDIRVCWMGEGVCAERRVWKTRERFLQ